MNINHVVCLHINSTEKMANTVQTFFMRVQEGKVFVCRINSIEA